MCKNIFAHKRRKKSIAAAGGMAVIGLYVRYISLFSVKEEKTGLDASPGRCINRFTFLSRWSPRDGQTSRRCKDPSPSRSTAA